MAPDTASLLVLEDVPDVRNRILQLLEDLDAEFLEAASAPSAAQAIEQHQPKVAILDIRVPGDTRLRNGIDVLHWAHLNYPRTAVIIVTNADHPQYRKTCTALGAAHFFDKSSEFEQLHDAVKELLDKT